MPSPAPKPLDAIAYSVPDEKLPSAHPILLSARGRGARGEGASGQGAKRQETLTHARELRRELTDHERLLWQSSATAALQSSSSAAKSHSVVTFSTSSAFRLV